MENNKRTGARQPMSTQSDWFSDYEDNEEAELEATITFERAKAIAEERQRVEKEAQDRREAAAKRREAETPVPDAIRLQAETRLGALRGELEQIDSAYRVSHLPELLTERALVVGEIRGRQNALPFVGTSNEELEAAVEPLEVAIEEARESRDALPENSARARIAQRKYHDLLNERDALQIEQRKRAERASIMRARERQVTKDAIELIRGRHADEIARLAQDQKGATGLVRRKLQLEIDHLRLARSTDPTEEELAAVLPQVTRAYDQRIAEHARRSAVPLETGGTIDVQPETPRFTLRK